MSFYKEVWVVSVVSQAASMEVDEFTSIESIKGGERLANKRKQELESKGFTVYVAHWKVEI